MSERACHVVVHGRVQGVYYRASTAQQAQRLAVRGWVRNRRDGTVEALLAGPEDAVQQMLDWMAQGPSVARVDKLVVNDDRPSDRDAMLAPGFETRETV